MRQYESHEITTLSLTQHFPHIIKILKIHALHAHLLQMKPSPEVPPLSSNVRCKLHDFEGKRQKVLGIGNAKV